MLAYIRFALKLLLPHPVGFGVLCSYFIHPKVFPNFSSDFSIDLFGYLRECCLINTYLLLSQIFFCHLFQILFKGAYFV